MVIKWITPPGRRVYSRPGSKECKIKWIFSLKIDAKNYRAINWEAIENIWQYSNGDPTPIKSVLCWGNFAQKCWDIFPIKIYKSNKNFEQIAKRQKLKGTINRDAIVINASKYLTNN
jgi:hypothetical protein